MRSKIGFRKVHRRAWIVGRVEGGVAKVESLHSGAVGERRKFRSFAVVVRCWSKIRFYWYYFAVFYPNAFCFFVILLPYYIVGNCVYSAEIGSPVDVDSAAVAEVPVVEFDTNGKIIRIQGFTREAFSDVHGTERGILGPLTDPDMIERLSALYPNQVVQLFKEHKIAACVEEGTWERFWDLEYEVFLEKYNTHYSDLAGDLQYQLYIRDEHKRAVLKLLQESSTKVNGFECFCLKMESSVKRPV